MPPDDPIFPQQGADAAAAPDSSDTGAAAKSAAAAAPSAPPTPEQVQQQISEAVTAAVGPLTSEMGAIKGFMEKVAGALEPEGEGGARGSQGNGAGAGGAGNASSGAPGEEFWNRFYHDPEGAVDERLRAGAAPLVGALAQPVVQMQLAQLEEGVDKKWGKGAYATLLKADMDRIIEKADPTAAVNPVALQSALNSVVGAQVDALAEHREKAQTQDAEANSKRTDEAVLESLRRQGIDPTTMTGGLRRVPTGEAKLPEEASDYIAGQLRDAGREVDEKRLGVMLNTGSSFSDWQKAQKELDTEGSA